MEIETGIDLDRDKRFDYSQITPGYYHEIFLRGFRPQQYWHRYKFEYIKEYIVGNKKQPEISLLDVGCGPGTFLNSVIGPYLEMGIGIDISAPQIEYARENNKLPRLLFEVSDIKDIDVSVFEKNRLFDYITVIEVIEHLNESQSRHLIRSLFKHIAPGGALIITSPNYQSCWPMLENIVNRITPWNYEDQHICRYNLTKLTKRITDSLSNEPFRIAAANSFLFISPFLSMINTSLSRKVFDMENKCKLPVGNMLFFVVER